MASLPLAVKLTAPRPELGPLLAMVALLVDDQRSVILHVTAARHGEGTTTVARELAAAAAQAPWFRVALVDAQRDAGPPGSPPLPPLLDAFEQTHLPALRQGRVGGAAVSLARLATSGHPAPKVDSVRGLFAWLRSEFTLVVLDCPPVLPCRDIALLAKVADGALLVVQSERTPLADCRQARDVLVQVGASVLGVVLNQRRNRVPGALGRMLG